MEREDWTRRLFESIDNLGTEAFLVFLDEDVLFRFGNADPVKGKAIVGEVVSGFFDSVKGIMHNLVNTWEKEGVVVCHGTVRYTRHDSTTLTVPFANIFGVRNDLIEEYLVFVDISELYGTA